jgi:hypothetical protein
MKNNKATGYDVTPIEFRKIFCTRRDGIKTLADMFNKIRNGSKIPLDWYIAIINPVYKAKGNREKRGKYRGVSPSTLCGRIYSGILSSRPRGVSVFQGHFIKSRRTTDNVFVIRTTINFILVFCREERQ